MADTGLDPAVVEQILAMQNREDDPQAIALARRQKMVDMLRMQAMQPQQGQMIGRRYVGPGIGGALQQVASGYMAGQQQPQIDAGNQQMATSRTAGRKAYFDALTKALRRGQGMTPPAMNSEDISLGY